jgi:S1-C subfamily serine protease
MFFTNAEGKIYGRYGQRDAQNADNLQSLEGLKYTMQSVLKEHAEKDKEFAEPTSDKPRYTKDLTGGKGRCTHCHQVREAQNAELKRQGKWTRDSVYRFPWPENVGMTLDVARGNVVKSVKDGSAAAKVGIKAGDVLRRVNRVPIHSIGDVQFGLERAPKKGEVEIAWRHDGELQTGKLTLADGWRKVDVSWRPSMRFLVPNLRLSGTDLTGDEKKMLELPINQVAFRQKDPVPSLAKTAGVQPGDVIVGIDNLALETDLDGLLRYVRHNYLIGDRITINLLRDGKKTTVPLTLR